MFGSVVLNVVIGLVFIYLLYSLLATILQEIISTWLGFRAKILERAIIRMLSDTTQRDKSFWARYIDRLRSFLALLLPPALAPKDKIIEGYKHKLSNAFYKHPLIKYLAEDTWHDKPGYITPQNFSKVIIDMLKENENGENAIDRIRKVLESGRIRFKIKNETYVEVDIDPETLSFFKGLLDDSEYKLDKFRTNLETWFNDTMERASGWYKRHVQLVLMIIGLLIAVTFNVDSIRITQKLSRDKDARDKMVELASNFHQQSQQSSFQVYRRVTSDSIVLDTSLTEKADSIINARSTALVNEANNLLKTDLDSTNNVLSIGKGSFICNCENAHSKFGQFFCKVGCALRAITGYLITALALSLGAPFWYDLLNKLMMLRGAVRKSDDNTGNDAGASSNQGQTIKAQ
ncbi:hypothetical protein NF867_11065 [Solitalea sp. MAHUQ-68]|uniref:Uncharacterized protein n=1 Tax=Solitalea agri TaxID=2953739 RepID=A0A9X2F372_9SPHI|nr:hypothetical protein [Solitalea agri]MCO4293406.1 hypothetical protein [Solitalea agri]